MSLSSTAAQQRDRQTRLSRPLMAWGIAGSLAFHAGILPVILLLGSRETPPEPAQLEFVVTEPVEPVVEDPETAVLDEETIEEPVVALEPPAAAAEPVSPEEAIAPEQVTPTEIPDEVVTEEEPSEIAEDQPNPALDNLLDSIRQRRHPRAARRSPSPSTSSGRSGNSSSETPSPAPASGTGDDRVAARSGPPSDSTGGSSRTVACRSCPKPSYPRSALDAGAEGTVNIMVDINADGAVTSASLVGSSGHAALDQAALSAVRNDWRFQPIRGGASGVVVSVVMTIQGSELNRRASERGDRESIEIPETETATEESTEEAPAASNPSAADPADDSAPSSSEPINGAPEPSTPAASPGPEAPLPSAAPVSPPVPAPEATPVPTPAPAPSAPPGSLPTNEAPASESPSDTP